MTTTKRPNLVDPVWTYYFDQRPLEINGPVAGYSIEEWRLGGKVFYKRVFTPDSIERMREATRQLLRSGQPLHNVQLTVKAYNGSDSQHFLVNYRPVFDHQQNIIGMRADARNITDVRVAQDMFLAYPNLFTNLIQSTPDQIVIFYFHQQPGFVNRGLGGFTAAEWIAEGIALLERRLNAESTRRFRRALEFLQASGEHVRNLELDFVTRQDSTLRILATFSPLFSAAGTIYGVQGIIRDITELSLTRAALRQSEMRFQELIENAHDLVWIVNKNGEWEYLNKAASTFYGLDASNLIGRHFVEVIHPDYRERDLQVFADVLCGYEVAQHESMHLHADGSIRHVSFNVQPRLDKNWEIVGAMGMARDITEQKAYERQLEHLAIHDVLTGLHNRHYFEKELDRVVNMVSRSSQCAGLLYIDMDNFKYVNDTLGHAAGDRLLLDVAQMLNSRLRQGDVLARFGGDEFTVLFIHINATQLQEIVQSFHALFRGYTFMQDEQVFDIRVSIGAALIDHNTQTASQALAQADLACTLAKSRGRNQVHIYNPDDQMLASMVSDVGWSRRINSALEHGHFMLYYQPVIRLADNNVTHYEVLLRLRDQNDSVIAPGVFLPSAERLGLINAIDRWVINQAVNVLAARHKGGDTLHFAVNLSVKVFDDEGFLPYLRRLFKKYDLDTAYLTFELTETAAISQMASARDFIEQLKSLGCQVALDDFGSGFSSYGYLKHLPVDYLKIDGSFVQNLPNDPIDQAIVRSMNQVAHALGKQTIAEFVEDDNTVALLREYGVDYAQGYHYGAPRADISATKLP